MNPYKKLYIVYQSNLKQGGSILISSLVALGIISISSVALVTYMRSFQEQVQPFERESASFNIHSKIVFSLQSLLIKADIDNNGDKQAQNTWGICSFLKSPNRGSGVELIRFSLSSNLAGRAQDSFSQQRWKMFFDQSEYTISSDEAPCKAMDSSFQSGYFSRCFKYTGERSQTANEMYVIARIVPKNISDFTKIDLSVENILDVKTVVFELQSYVTVFKGDDYNSNVLSSSKQYEMIWANSVSECHVQSTSNDWVVVQFSGSGTGRLSRNTVINSSEFKNLNVCNDLEFQDIPAHIIVSYKTTSDGIIGLDHSKNVRLACRKKVYRCPGVNSVSSDDYDSFNFNVGLSNDSDGILKLKMVNLTFVDDNSNKKDNFNVNVYDRIKDFDANKQLTNVSLNPGHSVFKFTVTDKNPDSLKNFCNNVCSGSKYFPLIKMNLKKAPGASCTSYSSDYTEDKYRLRCVACHSKMCYSGLGAYGLISDEGSVQGLVDEPLDGLIPECVLKKSISYDLPSVSSGSGNCVAMKVNSVNAFKNFRSAQYQFQSCSTSLPVLCFAYGHYLPAMLLSSPTSQPSIFRGSFDKAQEACYKMGRELIEKDNLAEYFKRFWGGISGSTNTSLISALTNFGLPSLGSNHFDYINNASRGIFIVPSYNISVFSNRLSQGSSSYLQKFLSSHNKLWVAMEKDGGSQMIGSIPQATVATSPFSVFTRKEFPPRALVLKDTNSISGSGDGTVLTYNIRYKGVYNVSGSGSNQALCRRGSGDFIFVGSTTLANAPTACGSGASFIPPLSSTEWIKAMALLNSNDEMYPFPSPGDFSGENYSHSHSVDAPKVWVALSKKTGSSGSSAKDWRLSKAWFPDSDSVFKTESIPAVGPNYIGIIDYKGKPVMPSMSLSTFLNFNFNSYNKACFTENGDQMELVSSVNAGGSCGSGKKAVDESSLKFKSVKFMSEWVQTNSSGNFIVNETLIQQAIKQAKRRQCKNICQAQKQSCDSGCASSYNTCSSGCITTTITKVIDSVTGIETEVTNTVVDNVCVNNCSTARSSCRGNCSSDLASCNNLCDSNNDISGHAYVWFP